jgi:uncharacterized protein
MKWIIIHMIRLYWKLIPEDRRGHCLFCETCSRHVYRITSEKGLIAGIKAFILRFKQCRPGYMLFFKDCMFELHVKNGDIIEENKISKNLLDMSRTFVKNK